jgi:hypothetical protein
MNPVDFERMGCAFAACGIGSRWMSEHLGLMEVLVISLRTLVAPRHQLRSFQQHNKAMIIPSSDVRNSQTLGLGKAGVSACQTVVEGGR